MQHTNILSDYCSFAFPFNGISIVLLVNNFFVNFIENGNVEIYGLELITNLVIIWKINNIRDNFFIRLQMATGVEDNMRVYI